jgi:hypothetical protein
MSKNDILHESRRLYSRPNSENISQCYPFISSSVFQTNTCQVSPYTYIYIYIYMYICIYIYSNRLTKIIRNICKWVKNCPHFRYMSGSIPGVWGFFPGHQTVPRALESTRPLKMSTRLFLGFKDGRCVRVTTLPPSCAECLEILEPQPTRTPKATKPVAGLL